MTQEPDTDALVAWLKSIRSPYAGPIADRIQSQAAEIAALREALEAMVEAFGSSEPGEIDRRLAVLDARAALSPKETDR